MKPPWKGSLRWCAPLAGLLLLATACGGSDSADLDQSLVKEVRSGFTQIEKADGSTMQLALHLDAGSETKDLCMMVRTEAKSASPNGERAEVSYFGSSPDIDPDGSCYSDGEPSTALLDGSVVYLPSDSTPTNHSCDTAYERSKITKAAAAELSKYGNETATSKVSKLIDVTKKITKHGSDIVLDLDAEKASEQLGNGGDWPDDSSATMTVKFADDKTTIRQIDVVVQAADIELDEYVRYQAVGEVQHLEIPKKSCVEASGRTLSSVSQILSAIGMSS